MHEARLEAGNRRVVQWTLLGVSCALLVIVLSPYMLSLPPTIGSDWTWYRNGPDRMAAHLPLYDPAMLRGPFDYLALGERWNMPPWALPLVLAFNPAGQLAWWVAMSAALVGALVLVWPRLPFPRGPLLGTVIVLSPPFVMGMSWGNMESLPVLGVALWFVGRRRQWWLLEAVGIALASIKVLPAIPLIAWSTLRDRRWRPTVGAAVLITLFSIPAILYGGLGVMPDFVRTQLDMIVINTAKNLSPMKLADPLVIRAVVVLGLVGALALWREVAIPLMLLLICFVVPNLYADWFLVPMIAVVASLAARPRASTEGTIG